MEPRSPALGARSLSHWTIREVPLPVSFGTDIDPLSFQAQSWVWQAPEARHVVIWLGACLGSQFPYLQGKTGCAFQCSGKPGFRRGKLREQPPGRVDGGHVLEPKQGHGRGQTAPAGAQGNHSEAQSERGILTAATAASSRHAAPHPLVGCPPLSSG